MILCTGSRSTILQAVQTLMPEERVDRIKMRSDEVYDFTECGEGTRIVLAGGYLAGLSDEQHTEATREMTLQLNYLRPMMIADQALGELPDVRICIIGSQSASMGSFDTQYAESKRKIQDWARRQRLGDAQQLVVLAPGIIADSGMTRRRHDYPGVLERRNYCYAIDVARRIVDLLYAPVLDDSNRTGIWEVPPTVRNEPC